MFCHSGFVSLFPGKNPSTKFQITKLMGTAKTYDLHQRTYSFAHSIRDFARNVPKDICNIEDLKQLVRSSGSVGANYIEANESLSDKDFIYRIKICRKEAKESAYWLRLIHLFNDAELDHRRKKLTVEASEFVKIFSTIIQNRRTKSS